MAAGRGRRGVDEEREEDNVRKADVSADLLDPVALDRHAYLAGYVDEHAGCGQLDHLRATKIQLSRTVCRSRRVWGHQEEE